MEEEEAGMLLVYVSLRRREGERGGGESRIASSQSCTPYSESYTYTLGRVLQSHIRLSQTPIYPNSKQGLDSKISTSALTIITSQCDIHPSQSHIYPRQSHIYPSHRHTHLSQTPIPKAKAYLPQGLDS